MAQTVNRSSEWGALATDRPRAPERIETKARAPLAQMSLDEKIGQMSDDTPLVLHSSC